MEKKNKTIKKLNGTPSKLRVVGDAIAMDQAIHIFQELFPQIANRTFLCTQTAGLYFTALWVYPLLANNRYG
jgi:hypothetical protein